MTGNDLSHERTGAEAYQTDDAVYLRRVQEAQNRGRRVRVTFRLDDGSRTETWLVSPGEVTHVGFWTKGRFFIAYRQIESLREEEVEAAA